eukprot:COSAG01_NODE_41506_length_450_cov_5.837607_1_plen_45_part_01
MARPARTPAQRSAAALLLPFFCGAGLAGSAQAAACGDPGTGWTTT